MTVGELLAWIKLNRERLIAALNDGSYQPNTVRGVEIPKPGGGVRQLDIPTRASYCTLLSLVSGR